MTAEPCCEDGPPGHTQQQHHDASPCYDQACPLDHPKGGPFPHPCDETVVCSYTVTHGLTCCWHHLDQHPSTWIVTLGDDRGRCEHYVCDDSAYAAAKGVLPEQHADQEFISMRVRRVTGGSTPNPAEATGSNAPQGSR